MGFYFIYVQIYHGSIVDHHPGHVNIILQQDRVGVLTIINRKGLEISA